MDVAIGLAIFAAVIGSHVFLWWSCRRSGASPWIQSQDTLASAAWTRSGFQGAGGVG
jgi:hypothetical protein